MGKHLADVSVEDIEQQLAPEPAPSLYQRGVLNMQTSIRDGLRSLLRQAFPNRVWLEALPRHDDQPHTWPEEIRFR